MSLIEDGERLILIDTGMGNKQSEKFLAITTGGKTPNSSLTRQGFNQMISQMFF